MICQQKHTKWQTVSPSDWKCPKCGVGADNNGDDGFIVDDNLEFDGWDEYLECELLHPKDNCVCYACGWHGTGATVSRLMMEKNDLITCPCCKGKGVVKKEQS